MTLQTHSTTSPPPPPPEEAAALDTWQGQWLDLVFGEGTNYPLIGNLENLLALEARIADQPIPQQDGDIPYGRWAAGRSVTLPFLIHGDPQTATLTDRIAEWQGAFTANDPYRHDWLLYKIPGRTIMARARVVRRQVEMSPAAAREGRHQAIVEIKLADPRIYNADVGLKTVTIPTGIAAGGGLDLPADLPWDMAATTGGSVNANNDGNATAYPVIRCQNTHPTGNIDTLEVVNVTTGVQVDIATTIAPGQILIADFDGIVRAEQGPHIRIDDASRYGDWQHPREILGFAPGNNTLTSDVTGLGASGAVVRADWLDPTI